MEGNISYDAEADVLYFSGDDSVQDSLDVGDFFVEFAGDGSVAGLEVLNASKTLSDITGQEFGREDLSNVEGADLSIYNQGEFAFIVLYVNIEKDGEKVRESVSVNLPSSAVAV